MTLNQLDADEARAELYEIMRADQSFEEKVNLTLELGEAYLGVQNAHLTRIDERIDFWEAIASTDPPDGDYPAGNVLDLQTTYCRRVVDKGSTIALSDAPNQGWADDPAFEEHGLNCYHGTPLTVEGEVFGTLCFVAEEPRDDPFSESETLFAELIARLLEHEVRHTRESAELNLQSNLIGVLSRVLRHNLRNDLTVIRGQLAKMSDRSDESLMQNEAAVSKIDKLIDLANTARQIESIASSDLDRQPVELNALLSQIIEKIQSNQPEASITIEGPEEVFLEAIPSLRTGLQELIENAAKHAGDTPNVTVALDSTDDTAQITVIDNGPGLPEQEQEVLREGVETPLIHGSGLGLWLAYWVIANHDGTIRPEITDKGTRITVTLPRTSQLSEFTDSESLLGRFQREQDKFEAVFEESFDAIVLIDDDGHYTDVNESAADLFGLSVERLRGRHISEFVPEEFDAEATWAALMDTDRERDTFPLKRPDSTERIVEYTAVTDVIPGQHLAILRDITERIEREATLQETTQQLEAIINASPDPIMVLDTNGVIQRWNEAAAQLFGHDVEQAIGKPIHALDLHSEEQLGVFRDRLRRAMEGETFTDLEVERTTADGEHIHLSLSTAPLRDGENSVTGVLAIARDITDRKEREAEISTREQTLRRLYEITADQSLSIQEQIESLLHVTRLAVGTDYATFSHIQDGEYEFEVVDVESAIDLDEGTSTPLTELPICERVLDTGELVAVNDVKAQAAELADPTWGISSYLGAPVVVDGEPYGTFCFYDLEARPEPFSEWERTVVQYLGDWVGMKLTLEGGPSAANRFQALAEGFPDLCFVIDETGHYCNVLASPETEHLLIGDPEQLVGRSVTDVLPPKQSRLIMERLEQTLETGESQLFRFELAVPAGTRLFEARTHPLSDPTVEKRLISMVVRDITNLQHGKQRARAT